MKKVIIGLLIGVLVIIGALLWKIYVIDGTLDKNGMINPEYLDGGEAGIPEDPVMVDGNYTYVDNEVLLEVIAGTWKSTDGRFELFIGKDYEVTLSVEGEQVLEDTLQYTYLQPGPVSYTEFNVNTQDMLLPDGTNLGEIQAFFHETDENGDKIILEFLKESGVQERVEFAHVSTDTGADQAETGSVDYEQVYDEILQEMYRIATDEDYADTLQEDNPAYLGISMVRVDIDGSEALGYCMEDLNRDGVPELIVGYYGQSDDSPYSHILYAAYTCQDNTPVLLFSGWYRNAYYYLGDGRFLNCGSNSAASSLYATYVLKPGETELTCEDYWFSEGIWTEDGEVATRYYHNTTGEYSTETSEKVDMTDEEFWQKEDDLATGIKKLPLISFADYGVKKGYQNAGSVSETEAAVLVQWYADAVQPPKAYDTFVAAEGEFAADALFTTDRVVNNFELFALNVLDITEEGKLVYETETLYSLDRFTPEKPLVVKLSFPGDLPAYGISYQDPDGSETTHRFSIGESGMDGSLFMSELN